MQNSIQALLDENPFMTLGLSPSLTAKEVQRAIEHIRLEASLGLRDVTLGDLATAEQVLTREPSCFEMRLFADWDPSDTLLGPLTPTQSAFLTDLLRLNDGIGTAEGAVEDFLAFANDVQLSDVLTAFAPDDFDALGFWADLLTEVVKEGTIRLEEPVDPQLVELVASQSLIPIDGVVDLACNSLEQDVQAWLTHLAQQRPPAGRFEATVIKSLAAVFDLLLAKGVRLQSILAATASHPEVRSKETWTRVQVFDSLVKGAVILSTDLHNAGVFDGAEAVLVECLRLNLDASESEELRSELRIVRLVRARQDFGTATSRRDRPAIEAALRTIESNTDDEEERSSARLALARTQSANWPPPPPQTSKLSRLWSRFGGLALLVGIGAAVVYFRSSGEGDPEVGDCIRMSTPSLFDVVDCSERNDGRVVAIERLSGTSYPTDASLERQAQQLCPASADAFLYPTRSSWADGDRDIWCVRE